MSRDLLKRLAKLEARQVRCELRSFVQAPGESREEVLARATAWQLGTGSRYEPLVFCRRPTPRIIEVQE